MEILSDGTRAIAIGKERVAEVHSLISGCSKGDVVPPGYSFTLEETMALFDDDTRPHAELRTVVGVLDTDGLLEGVVTLQPFELDGSACLEFMIFFRFSSRGTGAPVRVTEDVLSRLRRNSQIPVVTLVYEKNSKGKRFYTKAGFAFDRRVRFEDFSLELWKLQ
ncbi:MAG TPA: hypothetical protein VF088_14755 [Pyrinomonadaceae bacterium]